MAKRKRRQFHCAKCDLPVETYRKGKGHRVMVCPQCGIIAVNPFSFKRALKGALGGGGTGAVAGPWGAGIGAVVGGLASGFSGGGDESAPTPTSASIPRRSSRMTEAQRIALALG